MFDTELTEGFYYNEESAIEDGLSIVDTIDGPLPEFEDGGFLDDASELGLSLGFGEYIANERLKDLSNLTESTDRENMKTAISLIPIREYRKSERIRPFEKFVEDLCKGIISINDEDY